MIRQPIVAIMGHVDHGKTLLLDSIRGTAIAAKEAGGITQAIGASIIPLDTIKQVAGQLLETLNMQLTIPGLLFIDTPGHAAFVNLRKRGGNLADIAVLVIDINEGLKPQTKESIEILKHYKTPFVIALNKVDLIDGWKDVPGSMMQKINAQTPEVQRRIDTRLYEIVGELYEFDLQADRFDRVSDYTKQVALIPISAKTKEGIPEVLMMLTGLAQKFLEQRLQTDAERGARGTILEVKEQTGLGMVMDVIIYDGSLHVGDKILIGTLNEPIETRVKALFEPAPHAEMREKKSQFTGVQQVTAAIGVRVVAPGGEQAVAGMSLVGITDGEAEREELKEEVSEVIFDYEKEGILIKADSLGSLEALSTLLQEHDIPIKKSGIGPITKKDIADAEAMGMKNPVYGIIIGFNIPKPTESSVQVYVNDVIYRLIENFEEWKAKKELEQKRGELDTLVQPCKIELLKYVFRQSNPAIVGVEVLAGVLKSNTPLMDQEGNQLAVMKGIQHEKKNVDKAEKGQQVAASIPGVTVGRQIEEGDILYSAIPEEQFRTYKLYKEHLTPDQKQLLKEIADVMRKKNDMWGV